MKKENFDSIEELENAESNQLFSKLENPTPSISEFSELPTSDEITSGLTYKAKKEKPEISLEEKIAADREKNKDISKTESFLFGPDIDLKGDISIPASKVLRRLYRVATDKEVEPEDNFTRTETFVSGLIDGNIKLVKFPINIASELIDLSRGQGVDPDKSAVAKVEKYFTDSIVGKIGTEAEEIAKTDALGKLTSAAVQIFGLAKPTQALTNWAFKTTNKYFQAAKIGKVATNSKNIEKATKEAIKLNQLSGKQKFAAFMIGGGLGMAAVADPEDFGTLSGLFEGTRFESTLGVLGLDKEKKEDPQDEAARRLWNRTKLGLESSLISWPILYVGGKVGNILSKQSQDIYLSNEALDQWIEKYFISPLRARNLKSAELFEEVERVKNKISSGQVAGIDLIKDIDSVLLKIAKEANISKGVPEIKRLVGRMDELLVTGNDIVKNKKFLFEGFDNKKLMEFRKFASTEIGLADDQIERLLGELVKARNVFNNYKNTFFSGGNINVAANDFAKIMSERMQNMWTSEYRIFEDNFKIFPWLKFKPIQSYLDDAKKVLGRYAKEKGAKLTDEQLDDQLQTIIKEARKDPITGAPEFPVYNQSILAEDGIQFINIAKSFEKGKFKPGEFFKTEGDVKAFQRIFGQKRDLRNTIINTMSDLATLTAKDTFFNNILKLNNELIKQGRPGIFYGSPTAARTGLRNLIGGDEIITTRGGLNIKSPIGEDFYTNPLNGTYTTRAYADALNFSEKILFDELAKNTWYQHLVLIPKGATQISKTVLGPFTHTRNFITQGQFVLAQGNLFKNPFKMAQNFKRAFGTIQPQLLYRNLPEDQAMAKFLIEEGVMSTSAVAADLSGLIDDMSRTGDVYSRLFGRFGNGVKKLYKTAFDMYVAEDDIWKVYSTFTEFDTYKNIYTNAYKAGKIKNMPTDLQIMKQATKIVRDTIPNYGYVGNFVKAMRRSPLGNFMSWPAAVIRSGLKTYELAQKEMKDPILYAQGVKRMISFGAVTAAATPAITAMVHGMYGITNKMVSAARFFIPDFSRNNTIILTQDEEGNFKYIDASGAFVYDTITSPFQSVITEVNIKTAYDPDAPIIPAVYKGVIRGIGKLMSPFVSESIWLETFNNLVVRKGVTSQGTRLWNNQMDPPDKILKALEYFIGQVAPGSYKQFSRLKKAIEGEPGPRGEKYEVNDEVAGFYGLRQIKLNPLEKMDYKINEYLRGEADARKLYTVPLTKGGRIDSNAIIENIFYANRKKFELMANLKQGNEFAKILNVGKRNLEKVYDDRKKGKLYDDLNTNRFIPFKVTDIQKETIQKQYKDIIKEFDGIVYDKPLDRATERVIDRMTRRMERIRLNDNFNDTMKLEDYLIDDDRSELPAQQPTNVQPLPLQPQPNPQIVSKPAMPMNQQTGLTATETGLLTDAEKAIRLRQQGLA